MKRLHEGLDYTLYRIYAFGGLACCVIYIFVVVQVFDAPSLPDKQAFFVILGPLMLWFTGILLYWWWVLLFKGNRELEEAARQRKEELPGVESLANWNTLHLAMSIAGGNAEEFIRKAKKANRPVLVWYGFLNLLAVWICGPVTLGSLGIFQLDVRVWVGGVFVWIVSMLVLTYVLVGWGGKSSEEAYLAPLGLAITQAPGLTPDAIAAIGGGQKLLPAGPAIVEGERHGRLVHIEMMDKYSLTVLQARLPEFKVRSDDGRLIPEKGAPETVAKVLKSLRKAKRWQGVEINAGSEGIGIQRESKGTNMWLYDLWLAEYLLDRIGAG